MRARRAGFPTSYGGHASGTAPGRMGAAGPGRGRSRTGPPHAARMRSTSPRNLASFTNWS
jgi:hypothetical protein